jgi:hypothetical protein
VQETRVEPATPQSFQYAKKLPTGTRPQISAPSPKERNTQSYQSTSVLHHRLFLLAPMLILMWLSPVSGQETYQRSYTWSVDQFLNCPGNGSCSNAVPALSSSDYAIDTPYTSFRVVSLQAQCQVRNDGPENAAFDVGIIFGPEPSNLGSPPYPYDAAGGVYRGASFGWMTQGTSSAAWSIDFRNGAVNTWGTPRLADVYNPWLRADGNLFTGSQTIHVRAFLWSGAPSKFRLYIQSCSVQVVVEASSPVLTNTQVSTAQIQPSISSGPPTTIQQYVINVNLGIFEVSLVGVGIVSIISFAIVKLFWRKRSE